MWRFWVDVLVSRKRQVAQGMIVTMPWTPAELDRRTDEVLVDAYGDGEELGAWAIALGDPIHPSVPATVLGASVELIGVEQPEWGREVRARCRRDGRTWMVALADVSVDTSAPDEFLLTLAACRRYIGSNR